MVKDLKKQFDDIVYYLNKADKIVKDLGHDFSLKEFDALYFNRKFTGSKTNNTTQSINIIKHIEDYASKLYSEGSIKTSKGFTTTSHHLEDYLKKKNDSLLFPDVTIEFLNSLEKYFLGPKMNLSYSLVGVHMRNIRTVFNQAILKKIVS